MSISRREMLRQAGSGFGAVAATALLHAQPRPPAKSVIYLFMHGGVSHVDTFDPKPELARRAGTRLPSEYAKTIRTSFIHDPSKAVLRPSPWAFRPSGASGIPISDLFPAIRGRADDLAVIRGCYGEMFDHAAAIYLRNSGSVFPGVPVWARG
jgi:hypothetical protein